MNNILIGVSQCLLGDQVRYDGSHKRNHFITDELSTYVSYLPVCPEVAIGLGIPRKPIRLIATSGQERVRGVTNSDLDVTDALVNEAELSAAKMTNICGYIFMQNSPSCGLYRVKRYDANGISLDRLGRGAYAKRFVELMPLIPVEEAGRLADPQLRENFIARIFALHDWKKSVGQGVSPKKLIDFYSRYKYQVMAHCVKSYYAIGKLLSNLKAKPIEIICNEFLAEFMSALAMPLTRKGNANALMHLRGYLKQHISKQDKEELSRLIHNYANGTTPIIVPLTILKHHMMTLNDPYLANQSYWSPFPESLSQRNLVLAQ
jgi:uncharacterized protein YbgA (DUF1722 family)/uncharacterized protein YbbK (DUF523 family)